MIFEGETSYSYLGDAAIDDVTFTSDAACYIWPSHATPTTQPDVLPVPRPPSKSTTSLYEMLYFIINREIPVTI